MICQRNCRMFSRNEAQLSSCETLPLEFRSVKWGVFTMARHSEPSGDLLGGGEEPAAATSNLLNQSPKELQSTSGRFERLPFGPAVFASRYQVAGFGPGGLIVVGLGVGVEIIKPIFLGQFVHPMLLRDFL